MPYATGKYANAICDRCGWKYPYQAIKTEWDHARVCPECYEPKHPQLDPPYSRPDPEALQNPRPDRIEPIVVPVGFPNSTPFQSVGMQPAPIRDDLIISSAVGTVTVVIS